MSIFINMKLLDLLLKDVSYHLKTIVLTITNSNGKEVVVNCEVPY